MLGKPAGRSRGPRLAAWLALAAAWCAAACAAACAPVPGAPAGGGRGAATGGGGGAPLPTDAAAVIAISPEPADFGATPAGSTLDLALTARNIDPAGRLIVIQSIGMTGDPGDAFDVEDVPLPRLLRPGESLGISLGFNPRTAGAYTATLQITNDTTRAREVPVRASATAPGDPGEPPPGEPPPPGEEPPAAREEFRINRATLLAQRRPSVAALAQAAENGAVAAILFLDESEQQNPAEAPHEHWSIAAVDAKGVPVGAFPDPRVAHHTEGVGYIGLDADPGGGGYVAATRYHPSALEARSLFVQKIRATGGDDGAFRAWEHERIPAEQSIATLDIAADPTGPLFLVFRVAGSSGAREALPAGLRGRLVGRAAGELASAVFALSSAPNPSQINPRIAFNGSVHLVVWEENEAVKGRRFSAAGEPLGPDFTIEPAGNGPKLPRVAANPASGAFLVVWQEGDVAGKLVFPDRGMGSKVMRFNAASPGEPGRPAAACDPGTGVWLVAWVAPDAAPSTGIFARRFDAQLFPLGDDIPVNEITMGLQTDPDVAWCPAAGKFLVVWSGVDESGAGVKGRFIP